MALKQLPRIACSLNVGEGAYIYNFNYAYVPQEGVKMTLFFVNESGVYNMEGILSPTTPVSITLDGRAFNMYAIARTRDRSSGRRILKVDFIDETIKLENYYVVLTGQGCGPRIYPLGVPVDKRTPQQIYDEDNDPRLNNEFTLQIKKLTRFEDVEYKFLDFVNVLKQVFAVEVTASYDPSVTKGFPGSFKEVINAWCSYFNMSWYFENNVLKIVNPESINLQFPEVPPDALDESDSESLDGTFTKTAYVYFRQEGGELQSAGSLYTTELNLYPLGSELATNQPVINMQQVAAAAYGREYWFVWNWLNNTMREECGWEWVDITSLPANLDITKSLAALVVDNGIVVAMDMDKFEQKFEMYSEYGKRIAGHYYISLDQSSIQVAKDSTWYTQAELLHVQRAYAHPIEMSFFQQGVTTDTVIPGTAINKYYQGAPMQGNRIVYFDPQETDLSAFVMTDAEKALVNKAYNMLIQGSLGSRSLDYNQLSTITSYFVAQQPNRSDLALGIPTLTSDLINVFQSQYRPYFPVRGFLQSDSSTSYYAKLEICKFRSSVEESSQCLRHILVPRLVSEDIPVVFNTVSSPTDTLDADGRFLLLLNGLPSVSLTDRSVMNSKTSSTLVRDLSFVDLYMDTAILDKLALPQLQTSRTLSFTLNSLSPDIVLTDFVTKGLAGLSIDVTERGMTVTYTFSNAVQKVPISEAFLEKLELNIKNSWVSKYNPPGYTS